MRSVCLGVQWLHNVANSMRQLRSKRDFSSVKTFFFLFEGLCLIPKLSAFEKALPTRGARLLWRTGVKHWSLACKACCKTVKRWKTCCKLIVNHGFNLLLVLVWSFVQNLVEKLALSSPSPDFGSKLLLPLASRRRSTVRVLRHKSQQVGRNLERMKLNRSKTNVNPRFYSILEVLSLN